MRILNVCETAKGGIATYLNLLWKVSDNIEMRFVVQENHREYLAAQMSVVTFPSSLSRSLQTLRLFLYTVRLKCEFNPDIIFFHSTFTLPIMVLLRMSRMKTKLLYCPHGWAANRHELGSIQNRIVRFCERWMSGCSDIVVNISQHDAKYAKQERYFGTHVVVENAVEDRVDSSRLCVNLIDDDVIRLLFVGRFDHQKGLDILLDSFVLAREERPLLELNIVGGSVLGDEDLDVQHCEGVTLHGWVQSSQIIEYYLQADILIVPSRWEGFGLVVAEAMSAGTPAMVSDCGNLPNLIKSGYTGYVIPLSVNDFYQALINLDKSILRSMRPHCRIEFERRFHQDRFKSDWCDVLLQMEMDKFHI